jgi:hypothetical protein
MQKERMTDSFVPSIREYASVYQIDGRRLSARQVLMHPGPVNRGVELRAEVIDSPQAVIGQQVAAGVVVRMAVLYELLAGRAAPHPPSPPRPRSSRDGALRVQRRPDALAARRPRQRPADLLIRGAHVLDPRAGIDAPHDVLVRGGEIAELGAPGSLEAPAGAEVLDGEGRHLFPGFVDPHVHFRTPGQEHKEDLDSGTRSAAAGGFVAVDRDAEHLAGGRLRAGAALAARGRAARGARAGRLPRLGDDRPGRRRADRDGRAARHRRARLHRRRQAVHRARSSSARCSTSGCAAA